MPSENFHTPVLLQEVIKYLINKDLSQHIIVDGTLGGGSYTKLICETIKNSGKVISIDKDINAIEYTRNELKNYTEMITYVNANFSDFKKILIENGIKKITGLILDLGLSSYQLNREEGFSFMQDTSLDMRAYKKDDLTAADILNSYSKEELIEIFENYGEIGNSERLAKLIIKKRKEKNFKTTFDIVNLIKQDYKISKRNLIDFLAKIFQALRIKVNNELENLEKILNDSFDFIEIGGRIVVVSYHSLEDRIVKNFFKEKSKKYKESIHPFYTEEKIPELKLLTKKPIRPTMQEIRLNSRSRSAKLRAAEKI